MVHCVCVGGVRVVAKRFRHQAADKEMMGLPILTQCHSWIAFIIHKSGQKPGVWVFQAFDPPHIADKVLAAVAADFAPLFTWQIWNSVYNNHFLFRYKKAEHLDNLNAPSIIV